MSRICFYVLGASGDASRQVFACRLAEKACRQDNTVHIQVDSGETARRMDELLWTFRDGSFLPHDRLDNSATPLTAPVTVGVTPPDERTPDLLINLGSEVPESPATFPRIAEIVTSDDHSKTLSRRLFAQYRDAGHEMETHKL